MTRGSKRDTRSKGQWRFRDLLEAAPDAMVVVDRGGKIVLVNTQTEQIFGYQHDEMLGNSVEMLIPTRLRMTHRSHRANYYSHAHARRRGINLELFGLRKGGSEFPVEIRLSPIETEDGILVTNAIRDVSERKMLEELRFRLAAIVESSDDAIASKTLNGIITTWNSGATRMFGYTEKEAIGRSVTMLIPPELQAEEEEILERLSAGKRIDHYETIRRTKTGKNIDVSLSVSPVKDSSGRITGCSKIARDITDRKRSEAVLANVSRQMLEAVESERARIGRELHDDINQRLGMLAVEIDQLTQAHSNDSAKIQDRLMKVGQRITEISIDLSTISHQLHPPLLEVLGIVAALRSFCSEFARRQKVSINFRYDDALRPVSPEVSLCLFRVVQEALHNAVKYSNVTHLEVHLAQSENQAHLTVSDHGAGFDLEAAKSRGGLGLISMRERVRLVSGTFRIESKPIAGTRIDVRVPLKCMRSVESTAGAWFARSRSAVA